MASVTVEIPGTVKDRDSAANAPAADLVARTAVKMTTAGGTGREHNLTCEEARERARAAVHGRGQAEVPSPLGCAQAASKAHASCEEARTETSCVPECALNAVHRSFRRTRPRLRCPRSRL